MKWKHSFIVFSEITTTHKSCLESIQPCNMKTEAFTADFFSDSPSTFLSISSLQILKLDYTTVYGYSISFFLYKCNKITFSL